MYIQEFIVKHCRDMLSKAGKKSYLDDYAGLEYDYTITDSDGRVVPVVMIDNLEVPIADIIAMDKDDFLKYYSSPNSEKYYLRYLRTINLIEGEEAMSIIRNKMKEISTSLSREVEMMSTWSDLNS